MHQPPLTLPVERSTGRNRFVFDLSPRFRSADLETALTQLSDLIQAPDAELIAGGRNQNVRIQLALDSGTLDVMVKAFGQQKRAKDAIDSIRGSKARRSWLAANQLSANGVGTPSPIGYVERWHDRRLKESYFLSEFEPGVVSLNDALIELFHERPLCEDFFSLLERIADTCRRMHDAGFAHHDLGNQNILLRMHAGQTRDVQIIDLNRGRRRPRALTARERAQDLSRLDLPSGFFELFLDMYGKDELGDRFSRWHRFYRGLFQLRARSRRLRHPIREARIAREQRENPPDRTMPDARNLWVWDTRTSQAFSPLTRKERVASYPSGRYLRMLSDTASAGMGIWRAYRHLAPAAFRAPVTLKDRIGAAIEPEPTTWPQKRQLLSELSGLPLLLRFYHQDANSHHEFLIDCVKTLHRDGHPVKIALVQDRKAITHPDSWDAFVVRIIDAVGSDVHSVEVGHAINRVKWGVWDFDELARLYRPIEALTQRWPDIHFVGPATIDFEYAFTISALKEWPASIPPTTLSHHLYVDRRGAPENPQSGFNSIEKFALARAIAETSDRANGRVVVSEVNWPIDGTGSFSPIASPLTKDDESVGVDEHTYAAYMVRYLLLGIGSGFVDRIYWWRLVARGYGLVDDEDPAQWRKRPGYHAFHYLLQTLGDATFTSAKLPPQTGDRHGAYELRFNKPDGESITVIWANGPDLPLPASIEFEDALDMCGNALSGRPDKITGQPLYLRGAYS